MLEVKSIVATQISVVVETPTRKRKRTEALSSLESKDITPVAQKAGACFTNAAFSSTPKKIFGRRRAIAKENTNPFVQQNPCLEVKSIADIVNKKSLGNVSEVPANPFEVVRKPPKKKKCEDACFENPALNLDIPEKQFNPFEVVRQTPTPVKQCFVNAALNIRGNEAPTTLNPYEIHRHNELGIPKQQLPGVTNPVLTEQLKPTELKIGLPFTPNVGYRIDFKGLPLAQLTPSKLLAEKLVFSPIVPPTKRSLGAINEETTLDIGKELDCYQLELENSINEAKMRKHNLEIVDTVEKEQRVVCTGKLTEIVEADEEKFVGDLAQQEKEVKITHKNERQVEENDVPVNLECENDKRSNEPTILETLNDNKNEDVAYASDSEEEENGDTFKAPARFVRAYRKTAAPITEINQLKSGDSKESLQSNKSDDLKTRASVKNMIRKSIRKIMQPIHNDKKTEEGVYLATSENDSKPHNNIISTIRHSLRRKAHKAPQTEEEQVHEISIIDSSERVMKLKSCEPQMEYMKIEQLTNERKNSLRNSIRRSTRDVMRHVFHKNQHEAYATQK